MKMKAMSLNRFYRAQRQAIRKAQRLVESNTEGVTFDAIKEVVKEHLVSRQVYLKDEDITIIVHFSITNDFVSALNKLHVPLYY